MAYKFDERVELAFRLGEKAVLAGKLHVNRQPLLGPGALILAQGSCVTTKASITPPPGQGRWLGMAIPQYVVVLGFRGASAAYPFGYTRNP